MVGSLLALDASTAEPIDIAFIVDWEYTSVGKQVVTCIICVPDVRRCRLDLVAEVVPRVVKCIQVGAIIRRHTVGFVDARGSLGCNLKNVLEGSLGTEQQSLHNLRAFSHSCCLMMPRQGLSGYTSRSSMITFSSTVSTVCGPGMAATATLPVTQFLIEVGLMSNFAAALLIVLLVF